jgi:TPR repeat protein
MPRQSTWEMLQKTMRRLLRIRELGGSAAHLLANDLESCKRGWLTVPRAPEGMSIAWPEDLRQLAVELGFEPDVRTADEIDATMDNRLGGARPPYRSSNAPIVAPSLERARDLRSRIERGDIAIGILPPDAADEMVAVYRALGQSGDGTAWRELGECYDGGIGVTRDRIAALRCRRLGADTGDRQCALAVVRDELEAPEGDGDIAQRLIAPLLSDDQDGGAHVLAGYMAFRGFGEPASATRSADLHRKAAAMGNADAMFELYVLASTGQGMDSDQAQAMSWCMRAANLGQPRACYNLGSFYATGRGLPQNWPAAVSWYERAATLGNARAAAALATMYEIGDGVEADPTRAAYWDEIATLAGAVRQVKRAERAR